MTNEEMVQDLKQFIATTIGQQIKLELDPVKQDLTKLSQKVDSLEQKVGSLEQK